MAEFKAVEPTPDSPLRGQFVPAEYFELARGTDLDEDKAAAYAEYLDGQKDAVAEEKDASEIADDVSAEAQTPSNSKETEKSTTTTAPSSNKKEESNSSSK